ncbi:hypothetical protein AMTRI_Chr09g35640 [Amborella trichopoda]
MKVFTPFALVFLVLLSSPGEMAQQVNYCKLFQPPSNCDPNDCNKLCFQTLGQAATGACRDPFQCICTFPC